jgi:hypothetical protein
MLEVPFRTAHPLMGSGHYNPISIGAAAAPCPTRSLWWLALAGAVGGFAGWKYSQEKRRGKR